MITVVSKLRYTTICEKCRSELVFDYTDTDYIEVGYKDGIYGIRCPVCGSPIDRDSTIAERIPWNE